jgi:iron-sulfur cluster assembly protein
MITITDQAKKFILDMLAKHGKPAVELGLEPQGCNGYKYTWNPVDSSQFKNQIPLDDTHLIAIDEKYFDYFNNSVVSLELSRFDTKLAVFNPNVEGSCGCGESVNFKR